MAKTTIDIQVNTNIEGDSVKDLRQQFNEVEDALFEMAGAGKQNTEEFRNLQREAAKIKERVDDLNESIDMLKPEAKLQAVANVGAGIASGFAAAQGAMQLFGAESEEVEKSIAKVQAAMALAEGIQGVVAMGDSFKVLITTIKSTEIGTKAMTIAQRALNFVMSNNPVGWLIAGLTALVGVIGLVVNAMKDEDEVQKNVIAGREREIEVMRDQNAALQREADFRKNLAAAQGKSAEEQLAIDKELGDAKKKRINDEIAALSKNIRERTALIRNADEDERKEIQDKNQKDVDARKALYTELLTIDSNYIINRTKLNTEFTKKEQERKNTQKTETKKENNKDFEDALAEAERLSEIEFQRNEKQAERERQLEEQRAATLKAMRDQQIAEQIKADEEEGARMVKAIEDRAKAEEQKVELTKQGLTAIIALTDAFAGQDEASQRKAFNIKKAASLALATIETYQAASSAYASQMAIPTPDAPIRAAVAAGIAIASGLARVAVIAKTKFQGGGTPSGGGGGGGSLGTFSQGGGGGQPPQGLTSQNTVTQLNPDGTVAGQGNREAAPMKAYVVESESRAVTERVNKLSNNSKIG
jgi:hypothetical protein